MSLFGTDGVRGVANRDVTAELAFQIGQAAGRYLQSQNDLPHRAIMGRDTRISGAMLGAAVAAGLCSEGIETIACGVLPTGGISRIAKTGDYGLGIVISASHNPAADNGIKLMSHQGTKLPEEVESTIESLIGPATEDRPLGGNVGRLITSRDEVESYMNWLVSLVPERLEGMKVAIDAAHGAAYVLGIDVFQRLGAEVIATGTQPDGMNINAQGGATKPQTIQDLTQSTNADLGVAYDGDADRAVFSDSQGRLINGDRTMAIWCAHWQSQDQFDPPVVVGTVMSNGGFETYLNSQGIKLERAKVGDKYVAAKMRELNGLIGGEQSGHLIFSQYAPTGDGLLTALQMARVLKRENRTAADAFGDFENWPQMLINVQIHRREGWESNQQVQDALKWAEEKLGDHGRINVRPSGTQPMIRVMVEADSGDLRDEVVNKVANTMNDALGGSIYSRVDLTHALGD